ncbi:MULTISPECIES: bifunctional glutamate N-acetyltransferase/amino-acid acetyltransferase ArgJ [Vitreoscilla]|uniref:Arginine biosynthesis bifunctional protein ArgJ n=1 Tax=Vitreoscilla stercoraria TaxID=61 RepID=A0ABY4EC26_VITST|nr:MULTISPECIES: bifunctional glutamate N-acetyltransferase/amino-acid acetyltransferase ArgJ [Vitreoscilla]AUZ05580.1 arginine biosynthesis bifunctional protein ArgJ [Vitreoscilla sp. C1]UOO93002.1 bifunctional glutamate N-acetyltransferase/amino-acid acetyltransferase ArgJ [Vitreoscilla stercoraria]
MAVDLKPKNAQELLAIEGVDLFVGQAGVKKANHNDVTLLVLRPETQVAGVFTQNRFCAAPVRVCQELLPSSDIRALVVNTGNANAGTGADGLMRARAVCQAVASHVGCAEKQVLPFSTGVILEPLPYEKIAAVIPNVQPVHWDVAAAAIMTTDTVAKSGSRQIDIDGVSIKITGMSKGSGMIHPNMATMLGFVATDAAIAKEVLQVLVKEVADETFNCISVDGDTSTNDSFIIMATGTSALPVITATEGAAYEAIKAALLDLSLELAQAIVRDGEGATKFITVDVQHAKTKAEARLVADAIARSPLVKTAFFASDPNLGRLLCAVGYAGIEDLDVSQVQMWLGDVLVAEKGGRATSYVEEAGAAVMQQSDITVTVDLARGDASGKMYTCDFSYDYVKINAEYRS